METFACKTSPSLHKLIQLKMSATFDFSLKNVMKTKHFAWGRFIPFNSCLRIGGDLKSKTSLFGAPSVYKTAKRIINL